MAEKGTKFENTGEFTIPVVLEDTAGGKATYFFKLACIAPPTITPVVFNTGAAVAYPVPKITKITNVKIKKNPPKVTEDFEVILILLLFIESR